LRRATVSISNNDSNGTPFTFAIHGTGRQGNEENLWPDSKVGNDSGPEGTFYELGTVFRATVPGTITHLRVYALATESGDHTARLWRNDDNEVIAGPFTWNYGGSAGWVMIDIPDETIAANTDYTVVVSTGGGSARNYPFIHDDLAVAGNDGANLVYPAGAGVYTQTAGARPTSTFRHANYLRDVVFVPSPPARPRIMGILADPATGDVTVNWVGDGPVFQLEKAPEVSGPFAPLSAWQTQRVFTDSNAMRTAPQSFYRLRQ
jgi:hypothetical protein